jgi:hypothetical protein
MSRIHILGFLIVVPGFIWSTAFANPCDDALSGKKHGSTASAATESKSNATHEHEFIGKFLALKSPEEIIRLAMQRYPELTWLTGSVNATPGREGTATQAKSLSETIFGAKHIEFDRTATGILLLKTLIREDKCSTAYFHSFPSSRFSIGEMAPP